MIRIRINARAFREQVNPEGRTSWDDLRKNRDGAVLFVIDADMEAERREDCARF